MSLFSYERLYRAYLDCRKHKRNTPAALRFEMRAGEELFRLQQELEERTYRPSTSLCFVAQSPKLREIFAADFRDRILHHLLVRFLEPIWEPVFIYDSYASRPGKGIHLAVDRLQGFTRKATCNATRPAYYLQLDIRNFFMSINKHRLFALIRSRCSHEEALWLASVLLFHDPTTDYHLKSPAWLLRQIPPQKSLFGAAADTGLPIGNLTSQFWANIYLNGLDQFVKHTLKCRYYVRYVDDFLLVHHDRAQLRAWKNAIEEYLAAHLDLALHPSRQKLLPVANGIDFLGYVIRPTYRLCRKRVVNTLRTKLRAFEQRLIHRKSDRVVIRYDAKVLDELSACLNSYWGHFRHANTANLRRKLLASHEWLRHYVLCRSGKLCRVDVPPRSFRNLRAQYAYFARRYYRSLIFFQVGCFYEFYRNQAAYAQQAFHLQWIREKYELRPRCGIPQSAVDLFAKRALQSGRSVIIIQQTGKVLSSLVERRIALKYEDEKTYESAYVRRIWQDHQMSAGRRPDADAGRRGDSGEGDGAVSERLAWLDGARS